MTEHQPNDTPPSETTSPSEAPRPPDRLHRPPDEGPALTGGSATTNEDLAAEEEVGGG